MKETIILDKKFRESIPEESITRRINEMADKMNTDLAGKDVLFLGILNGAFMFASEIFKRINLNARISFVKIASYRGTKSSGTLNQLIGLNEDLKGKDVVILEDIIDSGHTLQFLKDRLALSNPHSIKICALLDKKARREVEIEADYVGKEVENVFIVGYGIDFNETYRDLPEIYYVTPNEHQKS